MFNAAGNQITPGGAPIALPGTGTPVFVATADFDQGGWTDIAVLRANPPTVTVYYNTENLGPGGVQFTPGGSRPYTTTNLWNQLVPTGMDVGDFNADGYPDIVVVGNVPTGSPPLLLGQAQVLLNSVPTVAGAPIGLTALPAMSTWGFNTRFVEVADFDGNGRDDFATANYGSDTVTVFLTDGLFLVQDLLKIAFKPFKIELECGHFPIGLAAGDFDRNGKMDLAVALQSVDEELCAQNPACIEIDFDIACGFNAYQLTHQQELADRGLSEPDQCPCKGCEGNAPPRPEIQTESETKK